MKKYILSIFFLISVLNLSAQKKTVICGKVKSDGNFLVQFFEPVNGYHNSFYSDTTIKNSVLINNKDSIYKVVKIDKPSFICVRFETESKVFINRTDVLVFPGDSLNLHFDLSIQNPDWVLYRGSNAVGQKLFNEINYNPGSKFEPFFEILNKLPGNRETLVNEIDNYIIETKNRFVKLKTSGNISNRFIDTIAICFKSIFYTELIDKFINNYKQRNVLNKPERDSILKKIVTSLPANKPELFGLYNYDLYLVAYYDYLTYVKYNLGKIDDILNKNRFVSNFHEYRVNENLSPITFITDPKMKEDIWAVQLLSLLRFIRGELSKSDIDQYCEIFQNNRWEKYLRKQLSDNQPLTTIKYELQSPIIYIDTLKNITTFNLLLKELPANKPVFVDCWASWCSPCIAAFGYNKQLDSLLLANNISKLYISLDNPNDIKGWKKSIDSHSLGGYHILASKYLIKDIERICNINPTDGFQIPRYLLVNSKSVLSENNLTSPENFELLKKQILTSNKIH